MLLEVMEILGGQAKAGEPRRTHAGTWLGQEREVEVPKAMPRHEGLMLPQGVLGLELKRTHAVSGGETNRWSAGVGAAQLCEDPGQLVHPTWPGKAVVSNLRQARVRS